MAVAAKPEIARILLDLGIEPVDVYAVDNAEKTYISALVEGINTLEIANKGDSTRSRILREELKGVREKKRIKVSASKLFAQKKILPASKIRPQALLPPADDSPSEGKGVGNILNGILNILRLGNKQDKKEAAEDRKERQRQRREKRESVIESLKGGTKKAASAGKKAVSSLISPFKKIWDVLSNFLKVTLLGTLINGGLRWFSDPENQRKITNLGRFFKDWWPSLLAGFLLFFTPIGTLVSKVVGTLAWAIPKLAALITKHPLLAAAIAAGGIIMAGAIEGEQRKEETREDFNKTDDKSITTVDEFKEENKNIEDPTKKKSDMSWLQGILELGSTPGGMKFNQGGIVPAPYPVDNVLGTLGLTGLENIPPIITGYNKGGVVTGTDTDRENTPPIITGYNKGGMVPGTGNKDTVPAMLTPGEMVIPKKDLEPKPMSATAPSMIPVKSTATARTPVGTPVKVKSMSTTTVLPPIKKPKPSQPIREGSTIPVFRVASKSNAREITIRSLGIEEAL